MYTINKLCAAIEAGRPEYLQKQCKKDVDAAKKQWGAKEAEEAALTMEIDELKKAIDEGMFVLKFLLCSQKVQNK